MHNDKQKQQKQLLSNSEKENRQTYFAETLWIHRKTLCPSTEILKIGLCTWYLCTVPHWCIPWWFRIIDSITYIQKFLLSIVQNARLIFLFNPDCCLNFSSNEFPAHCWSEIYQLIPNQWIIFILPISRWSRVDKVPIRSQKAIHFFE